jgi:hypothetical protein
MPINYETDPEYSLKRKGTTKKTVVVTGKNPVEVARKKDSLLYSTTRPE